MGTTVTEVHDPVDVVVVGAGMGGGAAFCHRLSSKAPELTIVCLERGRPGAVVAALEQGSIRLSPECRGCAPRCRPGPHRLGPGHRYRRTRGSRAPRLRCAPARDGLVWSRDASWGARARLTRLASHMALETGRPGRSWYRASKTSPTLDTTDRSRPVRRSGQIPVASLGTRRPRRSTGAAWVWTGRLTVHP